MKTRTTLTTTICHCATAQAAPRHAVTHTQAFCGAVGRPEWASRHWSAGELPGSEAARATRAEVAALIATRTAAQWLEATDPADCCVTPVLRLDEVENHAWFAGE